MIIQDLILKDLKRLAGLSKFPRPRRVDLTNREGRASPLDRKGAFTDIKITACRNPDVSAPRARFSVWKTKSHSQNALPVQFHLHNFHTKVYVANAKMKSTLYGLQNFCKPLRVGLTARRKAG